MFAHETVERCPACEELTPHSRRRLSGPLLVSTAALAGALAGAMSGGPWWILSGVLVAGALFVFFADRERFRHVRCERCRVRAVALLRKGKPTLRGNTEISLFP